MRYYRVENWNLLLSVSGWQVLLKMPRYSNTVVKNRTIILQDGRIGEFCKKK